MNTSDADAITAADNDADDAAMATGIELVKSMTIGHIYEVTYMQHRAGQPPTRNVVLGMCMGRGKSLVLLTSNLHRRIIQSRNVVGVYSGEESA